MLSIAKYKKSIKKILWLVLIFALLEAGGYLYGLQLTDIVYRYALLPESKAAIKGQYGIQIKTQLLIENYPASWLNTQPITTATEGQATEGQAIERQTIERQTIERQTIENQTIVKPVSNQNELARFVRLLQKELKKYPQGLIKHTIDAIYLLDSITIRGARLSSHYDVDKKSLYISNKYTQTNTPRSKNFLKRNFHHEVSAILFKKYHFDETIWHSAIGKKLQYKTDINLAHNDLNPFVEFIDKKGLLKQGFLKEYAETSVENDFNSYAEIIFTDPYKMKQLTQQYPIIQRKYQVFKRFYLSINSEFISVFEDIDQATTDAIDEAMMDE